MRAPNHTHLTELLREREGIDLSRPTVRRILTKAGIGSPRSRRSQQHRFRRRRMPQEGMLVQIDGSNHPWLEDRGPKLTLLIAVDDATGTVAQAGIPHQRGHPWLPGAPGRAGPAVGNPPGPLQRPPRCPSSTTPVRSRCLLKPTQFARVMRSWASSRYSPSLLRPRDGVERMLETLPGSAGHRAAPGRRQHHRTGQGGPPGVSAPVQRPLRGRGGAAGDGLPPGAGRAVPDRDHLHQGTPARSPGTTR